MLSTAASSSRSANPDTTLGCAIPWQLLDNESKTDRGSHSAIQGRFHHPFPLSNKGRPELIALHGELEGAGFRAKDDVGRQTDGVKGLHQALRGLGVGIF